MFLAINQILLSSGDELVLKQFAYPRTVIATRFTGSNTIIGNDLEVSLDNETWYSSIEDVDFGEEPNFKEIVVYLRPLENPPVDYTSSVIIQKT